MPLWFVVILLGIIEGITEFLPVSSTGHLLMAEHFLDLAPGDHPSDLFNVVIQCGAVLAVLPLFPERLHQFFFRWREKSTQDYLVKIFVAFVITGVVGFILDKNGFKLPDKLLPVAIALFVGGVAFVTIENWLHGRKLGNDVTWAIVFAVAFGQILAAVFPGTSRSGATILLALILGLNRVAATEYTFLVGIPTMLSAGGWKIFKQLRHASDGPPENWTMVFLGFVVAAVVSFFAVKWLLRYVQSHTFKTFGWYRIALALALSILFFFPPDRTSKTPDAKKLHADYCYWHSC